MWRKAALITVGSLLAVQAFPQSVEDRAGWHNLGQHKALVGRAHAWSVEFPRISNGDIWTVADGSALTASADLVLVTNGEIVRALRSVDGKQLWETKSPFRAANPGDRFRKAVVSVGRQVILQWAEDPETLFLALDRRSGKVAWSSTVPLRIGHVQPVGRDLACELWSRRRDRDGGRSEAELDAVVVIDGRSGRVTCTLSPTDQKSNRVALKLHCPIMLDQMILFGDRCTLNGVYCGPQVPDLFSPQTWILGNSLYTHLEIEDSSEALDLSGKCGLQRFALANAARLATPLIDLWAGKAIGRRYNNNSCSYFGPIIGPYKNRLLTTHTTQTIYRGTSFTSFARLWRDNLQALKNTTTDSERRSSVTSLVTLPVDGAPNPETLIERPNWIRGPFQGWRLSIGYLFSISGGSKDRASSSQVALFFEGRLVPQPFPRKQPAVEPVEWIARMACEDGVIYDSVVRRSDGSNTYLVHLEPFALRSAQHHSGTATHRRLHQQAVGQLHRFAPYFPECRTRPAQDRCPRRLRFRDTYPRSSKATSANDPGAC